MAILDQHLYISHISHHNDAIINIFNRPRARGALRGLTVDDIDTASSFLMPLIAENNSKWPMKTNEESVKKTTENLF